LTCGIIITGSANAAKSIVVTKTGTLTFQFDARSIPDRFAIKKGAPCGQTVIDTGFRGLVSNGRAASAPCCDSTLGQGCTGVAGQICPDGPGQGSITFPVSPDTYYIYSYGVCGGTAYLYTLSC